jgi:hypothetical protein
MRMSRIVLTTALALIVASATLAAAPKSSQAEAVIRAAAGQGRYVFVTFYKSGDAASTKMLADVKKIQAKLSKKASFTTASVGDPSHQALIKRYGVDRSPIPLMIVLAPNGAVTAGFPTAIKKTDFSSVFVSRGKADVLKALQDKKMAVLCLQNSKTKYNKQSLAAAKGLETNQQFSGLVRIVRIDPAARSESSFLRGLKVKTTSKEAQIVVVASLGSVLGKFSGAVTTAKVVDGLNKSLGGGGSNCGPSGGCAPGG